MSLNASSATIAASFATLVDSSYGGLEASVELINATHVVWRLELLTTWEVCTNQLALLPLRLHPHLPLPLPLTLPLTRRAPVSSPCRSSA